MKAILFILATSGIAITESNNVLVVSIDENGFVLDDQGIEPPSNLVNTVHSTYSFRLGGKHVIQCIFMNVSHPLNQPPKVTFANQQ